MSGTSDRVVSGMDPHKRSVTIEVMARDETVVGGGRQRAREDNGERQLAPARPTLIPQPALRRSHFLDPPKPRIELSSWRCLDREGSHDHADRGKSGCFESTRSRPSRGCSGSVVGQNREPCRPTPILLFSIRRLLPRAALRRRCEPSPSGKGCPFACRLRRPIRCMALSFRPPSAP